MNRGKRYGIAAILTGVALAGMTACGTENGDGTERTEKTEIVESVTLETMIPESAEVFQETTENGNTVEGSGKEIMPETSVPQESAGAAEQEGQSAENDKAQEMEAEAAASTGLQQITLDPDWEYADHSKINTGAAVLYRAPEESGRKEIVIGVNAGHGTAGGSKVKTLCHPDGSAKITGGSTAAGATEAAAVSGGMTFQDGTPECTVTLRMAQILRDRLLASGYDVLMLRDGEDVQLDNVARTVICNNVADCHIALHWDSGGGKDYDKGCFYISVPEALKSMEPVASHWQQHDTLGADLIEGLRGQGATIYGKGTMSIDLTQTSYSTIPSVDMELGNGYSDHSDATLNTLAEGLLLGIQTYFGQ